MKTEKERENRDLPAALAWPSSAQSTGSRQSFSSSRQEDERRVAGARGHTPVTSCFHRCPGHVYECHADPLDPSTAPLSPCLTSLALSLEAGRSRGRRQAPPQPPPSTRCLAVPRSSAVVRCFASTHPRALARPGDAAPSSSSTSVAGDPPRRPARSSSSPSSPFAPLQPQ